MSSRHRNRRRTVAAAVTAITLAVASCAADDPSETAADDTSTTGFSLAFAEEVDDDAAVDADAGDVGGGGDDPDLWEDRVYRLLRAREAAASRPPSEGATSTTRAPDQGAGGAPGSPTPGGGSPISGSTATTIGGGGGGDTAIYTGVLGRLGRNEVVVAARAAPPTVDPGRLPLTGLPGDAPNRPAVVVKVDNGGPARPQTGLNAADIVVEEEVEGGVTRFAVVFHSTSSAVGPVRSARTTDIGIINGFGSPLLLYSGANAVTDTLIRNHRPSRTGARPHRRATGAPRPDGRPPTSTATPVPTGRRRPAARRRPSSPTGPTANPSAASKPPG